MVVHALKTHSPRLHWTRRFPTTIRQSVSSRLTAYRKSSWLSVNQYFQKISKYISRISYRFCVFFVNKNTVDFLIENHPIIILKDHTLIKIRRIIIPAKRIMISNVSFAIPKNSIKALLQDHNIQLLSQITRINTGFIIKELAHILSFRRQV